MASSYLFNSIYEQVRGLGLPYEIKESGGSVLIKISSDFKQSFSKEKEKFRFHTKRTINGSNNQNWRNPQNYQEKSILSSPSLPDIHFFQTTPPPQRLPPPPPPRSPVSRAPPQSELPNHTFAKSLQVTSTPLLNPYRSYRRNVTFPKTPNLMNPTHLVFSSPPEVSDDQLIIDVPTIFTWKSTHGGWKFLFPK